MTIVVGLLLLHTSDSWLASLLQQHPEFLPASFHLIMVSILAGHIAMFSATLRDRRLISQATELGMCGLPNLLALAYGGYMLDRFPCLVRVIMSCFGAC